MPKAYTCKETFRLEMYDDGGFYTGEDMPVYAGAMFVRSDNSYRLVGAPDTVRLEGITADEGTWLEISEETLAEYFEEFKERKDGGKG